MKLGQPGKDDEESVATHLSNNWKTCYFEFGEVLRDTLDIQNRKAVIFLTIT